MKFSTIILVPLLAVSYVSAHGRIHSVTTAAGYFSITHNANESPIRMSTDQIPITDFNTPDLTCGTGAGPAPGSISVNPGDSVSVAWRELNGGLWPHNKGPILTYLAECDGDCREFDQTKARFFKIAQQGKKRTGSWHQEDIYNKNTGNTTFDIPRNLAPGGYLARHEIIALHIPNQPEFYPGCIQFKVEGNEAGRPNAERDLVTFPGEYKSTDIGFNPEEVDSDSNSNGVYDFPGGPIAPFVKGGSMSVEARPVITRISHKSPPTSTRTSHKSPSSSTKLSRTSTTLKPSLSISMGAGNPGVLESTSTSLPPITFGSDPDPTPITSDGLQNRYNHRRFM